MTSISNPFPGRIILILVCIFLCTSNIFAMDFKEYINQPIQSIETRGELRLEWNDFFGCDLFKPYFALKDMEDSFINFSTVAWGRLKGRLKVGSDYKTVVYKFKYEF